MFRQQAIGVALALTLALATMSYIGIVNTQKQAVNTAEAVVAPSSVTKKLSKSAIAESAAPAVVFYIYICQCLSSCTFSNY